MNECKVDGCLNEVSNKETGLCHKHYLRLIRYGSIELSRNKVQHDQKCIVDGCDRYQETNLGYCLMHYKRFKRNGTTNLVKTRASCMICGEPAKARGLCRKHYMNLMRHGDPEYSDHNKNGLNQFGYKKIQGEIYKVEHRVIAAKMLGRELMPDEIVHHIDMDKTNNDETNLFVCTKSKHSKLHQELMRCGAELLRLGFVEFVNGHYHVVKNNITQNNNLRRS